MDCTLNPHPARLSGNRTPPKPRASNYTVVYSLTVDGDEFISAVVRPGISDSELMSVATELHKQHPRSTITFYDGRNLPRITQWWKCLADAVHKIDNPRCPDMPDEWISAHNVGAVRSYFDNPSHTGALKWYLERGSRRIGVLGVEDRPIAKMAPVPTAPQRPQIRETVRLQFGHLAVIAVALTPDACGEFTRCFDGAGSLNCVGRLFDARKVFQVPSGTKAEVLALRENPYRASALKGGLVQVRLLEGAFRGQAVWTLESRVGRLSEMLGTQRKGTALAVPQN